MNYLLFNPTGRILKNRFWQGLVVLTVASIIFRAVQVYLGPALGMGGGLLFFLVGLALIYVEICVYAKRFHDAGTTGWWILAVWVGSFILSMVLNGLFGPIFLGEEGAAVQQEVAERLAQGDWAIALEGAERIAELTLPLTILTLVVNAVVLGFIVGSLATEPRTNKHGPVPGTQDDEFR
ncbi:DUF805 domain-containing protein [Henriciella aquimarina]|uniref:DUF805 domain-containing protein n=1 Tax=Henriciella aquimarina TaxID=545261 RepID=UPI0009FEEAD3|nr:DUF805 domain-containing protein [Henriciella aquimarina]